jgi:uncharacterized membrane protein
MPTPEQERLDAIAKSIAQLWRRQDEFAQRLAQIEAALSLREAAPPEAAAPTPIASFSAEQTTAPVTEEAPPLATSDSARIPGGGRPKLETRVGLTIVNRVGVVTLVLGVAFFFKWAVDNNWIGPGGRVILGVLASFASLGAADFLWRKGQQVFAQGVTGTGIAVLYLSFYAAFGFYHLISQAFTFLLMFAATGMAITLSLRYSSQAIAALGFFGGYLTPLLLNSGQDRLWFLFGYILLLSIAVALLAKARNWRAVEVLSFPATAIVYGGWLTSKFDQQQQKSVAMLALLAYYGLYSQATLWVLFLPGQFLAALALSLIWSHNTGAFFLFAFLLVLGGLAYTEWRGWPSVLSVTFASFWISYGLWELESFAEADPLPRFLGISVAFLLFGAWFVRWLAIVRQRITVELLSVLALNGIVYYATAYTLLNRHYHACLGLLAVAVAGAYFGFAAYVYRRRTSAGDDMRPVLLSLGISLCFLTLAIPIQFTGFTITIAWSLQAAVLTWIGARLRSQQTVAGALLIVFMLVLIRLIMIDGSVLVHAKTYQLLLNRRFVTFLVAAISFFAAAYWASQTYRLVALVEYFAGHIALLWGLVMEVIGWAERSTLPQNLLSVETVTVSILFGIYAVALVSVGVSTRTSINRLTGLGLIGMVIVKLYLFDVWQLGRVYRISAFVVLGLLLISTSFLYSRFRRLIESLWKDEAGS